MLGETLNFVGVLAFIALMVGIVLYIGIRK